MCFDYISSKLYTFKYTYHKRDISFILMRELKTVSKYKISRPDLYK